jgi:hypothetical protein
MRDERRWGQESGRISRDFGISGSILGDHRCEYACSSMLCLPVRESAARWESASLCLQTWTCTAVWAAWALLVRRLDCGVAAIRKGELIAVQTVQHCSKLPWCWGHVNSRCCCGCSRCGGRRCRW